MYLELPCSSCGESAAVSFESLYELWSHGVEKVHPDDRNVMKPFAEIQCHCGHAGECEGAMFQYVFNLIFDEFIRE